MSWRRRRKRRRRKRNKRRSGRRRIRSRKEDEEGQKEEKKSENKNEQEKVKKEDHEVEETRKRDIQYDGLLRISRCRFSISSLLDPNCDFATRREFLLKRPGHARGLWECLRYAKPAVLTYTGQVRIQT
jgi:hypothetical protein